MNGIFREPIFPEIWKSKPTFSIKAIEDACKKIAEEDSYTKQMIDELLEKVKELEIRISALERPTK